MKSLYSKITTAFGEGATPDERQLVSWDGFDVLEKEGAVRFFAAKTWGDVLTHLRGLKDQPVFRGAYFHEEWSVLSSRALAYYARAYLEFLRETLATEQPDEEFVFYFLGALYQIFYMHKGSPFSPVQTNLLRRLVEHIGEKAAAGDSFEYFADDITRQSEQVLSAMGADV